MSVKFFFMRLVLYLLGCLPRLFVNWLCDILGAIIYHFREKERTLCESQLQDIFGKQWSRDRIRSVAKKVFQHQLKIAADFAWMMTVSREQLVKNFDVQGAEHLFSTLSKGRGAIVVSFHIGTYLIGAAGCAADGNPLCVVYKVQKSGIWEHLLLDEWRKKGIELVPRSKNSREDYENIFHQNKIFTTAIDQDAAGKTGVFIDFLGKPASTYCGFALLAHRYGAPLIPVICLREPDGRGKVTVHEPIPVTLKDPSSEKELADCVKRASQVLENYIYDYPEQWLWLYRRWRTPAGGWKENKNGKQKIEDKKKEIAF